MRGRRIVPERSTRGFRLTSRSRLTRRRSSGLWRLRSLPAESTAWGAVAFARRREVGIPDSQSNDALLNCCSRPAARPVGAAGRSGLAARHRGLLVRTSRRLHGCSTARRYPAAGRQRGTGGGMGLVGPGPGIGGVGGGAGGIGMGSGGVCGCWMDMADLLTSTPCTAEASPFFPGSSCVSRRNIACTPPAGTVQTNVVAGR